jgi:hypothetical protein
VGRVGAWYIDRRTSTSSSGRLSAAAQLLLLLRRRSKADDLKAYRKLENRKTPNGWRRGVGEQVGQVGGGTTPR